MKTVVVRKYDNAPQAYVDAAMLRSEGIECEVMGESGPYSTLMFGSVCLVVLEDMREKAEELLKK